jgi:hypothetical protein
MVHQISPKSGGPTARCPIGADGTALGSRIFLVLNLLDPSGSARPEYRVTVGNILFVEGVRVASVSSVSCDSASVPYNATNRKLLWIVRAWVCEYLLEKSSEVVPGNSRAFASTLITGRYLLEISADVATLPVAKTVIPSI